MDEASIRRLNCVPLEREGKKAIRDGDTPKAMLNEAQVYACKVVENSLETRSYPLTPKQTKVLVNSILKQRYARFLKP